jgi:hemolysin III
MNDEKSFYTKGEEIANAISHGLGAILSITALVLLIVMACKYGDAWHIVSFSIFGASLVILYLESTLYHSITNIKAKKIFRIFDHSSIFLLIAGTYTPFTLTVLRGALGWTIFGVIWSLTILGIVIKCLWLDRYDKLSTLLYVLMGWMIIISIKTLWLSVPHICILFLVLGGIIYTLGALLFHFDNIPYNHAIWHFFVIGGSVCHFFSVIYLL